tara:strand:+ start:18 stop:368 length:351 start_codon:yes stop_codon:yes gene_type:complete
MCGGVSFSPGTIAGSFVEAIAKNLPGGTGKETAGTQTSLKPKVRKPKVVEQERTAPTEPEEEIEEPAGDAATQVTKKYARRGRKANILAGAMGGMNMERIRRRRMLGSFSEPMGQY